jgi:hypothetical protein
MGRAWEKELLCIARRREHNTHPVIGSPVGGDFETQIHCFDPIFRFGLPCWRQSNVCDVFLVQVLLCSQESHSPCASYAFGCGCVGEVDSLVNLKSF